MEDRRGDRAEDAERRRDHRHGVQAEREADDVLADDRDGRPRQLHQVGQDAERLAEDDEVARLGREVGADAAQGDPGVRPGQRRGVVDPVADHRHPPARRLPLLDPARLVGREQLGRDGLDVRLLRDGLRGAGAVAGQDRDLGDLQVLQVVDDVVRLGPDGVAGADQPDDLAVERRRSARVSPRASSAASAASAAASSAIAVLGQQPAVADEDGVLARRRRAGSGPRPPRRAGRRRPVAASGVEPALGRRRRRRRGQRVLARRLGGRGQAEHVGLGPAAPSGTTLASSGRPRVSVPVLSKANVSHSASRSSAAPPLIRTPCRASQAMLARIAAGVARTRAHGQATTSTATVREPDVGPAERGSRPASVSAGDDLDHRQEVPRQAVGRPLERRLAPLGLGDQPEHLAERRLVADLLGPDLDHAELVDRPGVDRVARPLVDRQRLARQRRLIDGRPARDDRPVDGDPLAGPDDDEVADDDLRGRDLDLDPVAADPGGARGLVEQPVDRALRSART